MLEKVLQRMYVEHPELEVSAASGDVSKMKALLGSSSAPTSASLKAMAGNQRVLAILAALENGSAEEVGAVVRRAVTRVAAVALAGASEVWENPEGPEFFEPWADERSNLTSTSFAPATVLRATRKLAVELDEAGHPEFREVRNKLSAESGGEEDVGADAAELLSESKVLQELFASSVALTKVKNEISSGGGSLTTTPKALQELFHEGQEKMEAQMCSHGVSPEEIGGTTIPGVPRLDCGAGALYELARLSPCHKSEAECAGMSTAAEMKAKARQEEISQESAVMTAADELLRPADTTAAEVKQATTEATKAIETAKNNWDKYEEQKADAGIAKGVAEQHRRDRRRGDTRSSEKEGQSEGLGDIVNVGEKLWDNGRRCR